jgi:hypothetical protein
MKVNHLNLTVTDPVETQQFFVKYFGLKPRGKGHQNIALPSDDNDMVLSLIDKVTHATVNMHLSWGPELRYSNLFWALPDKHCYMAVGYRGQVIMIYPDLDVVAVTTGPVNYQLSKLADYISVAVISDTSLPPDAASESLLANKIRLRPYESVADAVRLRIGEASRLTLFRKSSGNRPLYAATTLSVTSTFTACFIGSTRVP